MSRIRVMASPNLTSTITELLQPHVDLLAWTDSPQVVADEVEGIYVYGAGTVDASMIDGLPKLKVISNHGVGTDHIDSAYAARRSIPVGNTPDVLNGAVADAAWGLLLAVARRISEGDRYARHADHTHFPGDAMLGREVHGGTLGIIGMGRIGTEIARRAAGFQMQVLYHNRKRNESAEQELARYGRGPTYCTLPELLAQADFIVLAMPASAATDKLVNASAFAQMQRSAILINVGRGSVVDTEALTRALEGGQIAGAGLDVTAPEPLPRDHPLLAMDQVVITPHLGSASDRTRLAMARISVENLLRGLRGEPLLHQVIPLGT